MIETAPFAGSSTPDIIDIEGETTIIRLEVNVGKNNKVIHQNRLVTGV
jgi:hypothetical protein